MLSLHQRNLIPRMLENMDLSRFLSKVFKKIIAVKLSHFLENNSLLPPSQFLYRRGLRTCNALLTLSPSTRYSEQEHGGKAC